MPDSPFCPTCLDYGDLRHTYKLVGASSFKCGTCKNIFLKSDFRPEEFLWKDDYKTWREDFDKKAKKSKQIKEELKRIESISKAKNVS